MADWTIIAQQEAIPGTHSVYQFVNGSPFGENGITEDNQGGIEFYLKDQELFDAVEKVGGESAAPWSIDSLGTLVGWGFGLAPVGVGLNADATD